MANELGKLPAAIRLARRAMRVVHQNVVLSLAAVAALVTGALASQLTLTEGLLLSEGTALLIIANGLRLLRGPAPHRSGITRPRITPVGRADGGCTVRRAAPGKMSGKPSSMPARKRPGMAAQRPTQGLQMLHDRAPLER
jgi:hypothetical protein